MLKAALTSVLGSTARVDRRWIRAVCNQLRSRATPTIFDVGAHVGSIAFKMARRHPQARVHAIEASPATATTLAARCKRHSRVTAYNLAVSDTDGHLFVESEALSQTNRVFSRSEHASQSGHASRRSVACRTIDGLMAELNCPFIDFLKIDTEGHELLVLGGARSALESQAIDLMLIEGTFNLRRSPHTDALSLMALLRPLGYDVLDIYNYGIGRFVRGAAYSNILFGLRTSPRRIPSHAPPVGPA